MGVEMMVTKYVLGIDTAWTETNPSGVALIKYQPGSYELIKIGRSYEEFCEGKLEWDKRRNGSSPDMQRLIDCCKLNSMNIHLVSLDIPLSPQPITERRVAEHKIATAYGAKGAAPHTPNINRPGPISETIFGQLTEQGYSFAYEYTEEKAFIEVYPHTGIIELFNLDYRFPYKVGKENNYWPKEERTIRKYNLIKNLATLKEWLGLKVSNVSQFIPDLNPNEKYDTWYLKHYEDVLDAVVCGLTGCFYLEGKTIPYGNNLGTIWVPKRNS